VRHPALRKKGIAVAFIVYASRGEDATTTIRLSVVVAIAKERALAEIFVGGFARGAPEQGDVFTPKRTRPKFSFGRVCR
jgi:hypothetical protein